MNKRVFVVVLDSFGIGEMPDAAAYGDEGSDTYGHICERTGMRYVNIHSFRHLNASLLINSGADVKTVSSVLGHAQTSTTLNIYAHSFATAQAAAIEAVANAIELHKSRA